jgi:thioredoxin reductase/bacterioferritin-associated ferredoxin
MQKNTLDTNVDLLIIGAGPAGMAAALQARALNLRVAVLDEQSAPGGQIYRSLEQSVSSGLVKSLGKDYANGFDLIRAFRQCGANYFPEHQVWQIEGSGRVFASHAGSGMIMQAKRIIIAIGAMERAVPIAGWTLPGVMTVGAAQIMLKTAGLKPNANVWLAGSGPLALAYAVQLIECGGQLAGILDTSQASSRITALHHWAGAIKGWRDLVKGLSYHARLSLSSIKIHFGARNVRALGSQRIDRVQWESGARTYTAHADGLLLHEGVIPNTHMTQSLDCQHIWDKVQQCYRPQLDSDGLSTISNIYVAGDCAGVAGALAAEQTGRLTALAAAASIDVISLPQKNELAAPIFKQLRKHLYLRPFLDSLYAPSKEHTAPTGDVVVCRCENITSQQIRHAVESGYQDINQVKSHLRCGMGPCQGRTCASTLTSLVCGVLNRSPTELDGLRIRPPLKPISLGELASLSRST